MKHLLIYLREKANPLWMFMDSEDPQTSMIHSESLAEIPESYKIEASVDVLVPGTQLMLLKTEIPPTNQRNLIKALPFVLEEYLVDIREKIHYAVLRNQKGCQWVAVVSREVMDDWLTRLQEVQILPDRLLPDLWCLPESIEDWHALVMETEVLCRSPYFAFSCERGNASSLLALWLGKLKPEISQRMQIMQPLLGSLPVSLHLDSLKRLTPDYQFLDKPLLHYFFQYLPKTSQGFLLQGDYLRFRRPTNLRRSIQWLLKTSVLVWLLSFGLVGIAEYVHQDREHRVLVSRIASVCGSIFPNKMQPLDCKQAFESEIKRLTFLQTGNVFLALLNDLGPVFYGQKGLSIESMNFQEGTLILKVHLSNFQDLDKLNQSLKPLRLKVDRSDTRQEAGRVVATFHIRV